MPKSRGVRSTELAKQRFKRRLDCETARVYKLYASQKWRAEQWEKILHGRAQAEAARLKRNDTRASAQR